MFSILSSSCNCAVYFFFFPLKYVITEALPLSLMGSALASDRSILELVALVLSDTDEASGSFSQKPPLVDLLLPKPLPCKPSTFMEKQKRM